MKKKQELIQAITELNDKAKWQLPALVKGNKTATNYDSRVANFSTQTKIVTLSDGQRFFLVNNYRSSWVHRGLDTFMKWATGSHMKKARSKEWKSRFEQKSQIPTVPNSDPNTIVMPFISNINLYDLVMYRDQMKDVGECEFAKNISAEDLLRVVEDSTKKIEEIHSRGIAWGELILPNMIIDKDQKIHVCDPEVAYDEGMPLGEQKARDLLDFIISASAALSQSAGIEYSQVVQRVLSSYHDQKAIEVLQELAKQKTGFFQKIFFGYTKARLGLKNPKEYEAIKKAISEYVPSESEKINR